MAAGKRSRMGAFSFRAWVSCFTVVLLGGVLGALGCSDSDSAAVPEQNGRARNARILVVRGLAEALVSTQPTEEAEDRALHRAIAEFDVANAVSRGDIAESLAPFERFVRTNPHSAWAAAVFTNLGLGYYHGGYFTRALSALESAWREGKTATEPQARAIVDRAVGELAKMHARVGHSEDLSKLFDELGSRAITGGATELVTGAREGMTEMQLRPGNAYLCGPKALQNTLLGLGSDPESVRFLDQEQSGPRGYTLAQVSDLAATARLEHRTIFRAPGQSVPVPSIVNWKIHHYAAITARDEQGLFHIQDPTFGGELAVSEAAIDEESSGFFLVPAAAPEDARWRDASAEEARAIYGMGFTNQNSPGAYTLFDYLARAATLALESLKSALSDILAPSDCHTAMCEPDAHAMAVSLNIKDTPVGYAPQMGPPVFLRLVYNQREAADPNGPPGVYTFFNVGPKWTLNALSYVEDDPNAVGTSVTRLVPGGGALAYSRYSAGVFAAEMQTGATLTRTPATGPATSYTLKGTDGSALVYAKSDEAPLYPRRLFLSSVVDARGNALEFHYDDQLRLISITDAMNRTTSFSYDLVEKPLLITAITDPFKRKATLEYDASGRLASITDVIDITSSFHYNDNGLLDELTTPYGTSTFRFGETVDGSNRVLSRFLEKTDPLNQTDRLEFVQGLSAIGDADAVYPGPGCGTPPCINVHNGSLSYRNSFYWDPYAYKKYVATGTKDYTKARRWHWLHTAATNTSPILESTKQPLENRVWYNTVGQGASYNEGTSAAVTAIGRVLEDGKSQISSATYNPLGKIVTQTDPLGRLTRFTYDTNNVDLLTVQQQLSGGSSPTYATLAQVTYNAQHLPLTRTDASGNKTRYTYDSAGQLLTVIDPQQNQVAYGYDRSGRIASVSDNDGKNLLTLTYDAFDHIATMSDTSGYGVAFEYDALDRVTRTEYPDGTSESYEYDNLDLVRAVDRLGRETRYEWDANRRLKSVTNALHEKTAFAYHENGILESITDARDNVTSWDIDVQGRVTAKHHPDGTTQNITYEGTTSRVSRVSSAGEIDTVYTYNVDNSVAALSYESLDPARSAEPVSFRYDPIFPRLAAMTDEVGQTDYSYYPISSKPSLGAGMLKSVDSPVAGSSVVNDSVRFVYDQLNRVKARSVNGAAQELEYDSKGRVTALSNPLGNFAYAYAKDTGKISSIVPEVGPSVDFSYLGPTGDQLLESLTFKGAGDLPLSQFGYSYDAAHNVSTFTQAYAGQSFVTTPGAGSKVGPLQTKGGKSSPRTLGKTAGPPRAGDGGNLAGSSRSTVPLRALLIFLGAALAMAGLVRQSKRRRVGGLVTSLALALLFVSCGSDHHSTSQGPLSGEGGAADGGEVFAGGVPATGGNGGTAAGESPSGGEGNAETGGATNQAGAGNAGEPVVEPNGGRPSEAGASGSAAGPSVQVATYQYDQANRLISATVGTDLETPEAPQFTYTYDAASNITGMSANGDEQTFDHKPTNAIARNPYDLDGNPKSLNGKSYEWDALNRVVKVVEGEKESQFSYDGLSRLVRIRDFEHGALTADRAFVWCGSERCGERDNMRKGSPVVKQFFSQGMKVGGADYYYVTDALGSVRQLVDAHGEIRAQYEYDPYGKATKVSGDVDSDIGYAGYFSHQPTSLDFALYRAYDPSVGRWLNRDPIAEAGGLNLYEYVGGNPINRSDPSGLLFGLNAGECYGERAAEFYADKLVETGNPLYWIPLTLSSLWTPGMSDATFGVLTLGLAWELNAAKEVGEGLEIGYHATRAENVGSILKFGLRESAGGRAGSGVYVSNSVEGALAEFGAHNPGVTPAILEIGYSRGLNYFVEGLTNPYVKGALQFAGDTLSYTSVRLGGTVNTVIRNGTAAVLR